MFKYKRETLRKRKKTYKKYYKYRQIAALELRDLMSDYKKRYPKLDNEKIYLLVKEQVLTIDKDLNYVGATLIPLTFVLGILAYAFNYSLFNNSESQSIIIILQNFINSVNFSNLTVFEVVYIIAVPLIILIILYLIQLVPVIFLIYLFDKIRRRRIIVNSIKTQLITRKEN